MEYVESIEWEYVESIEWEYVWSVETMWSQEIEIGGKVVFKVQKISICTPPPPRSRVRPRWEIRQMTESNMWSP